MLNFDSNYIFSIPVPVKSNSVTMILTEKRLMGKACVGFRVGAYYPNQGERAGQA